MTGLIDLEGTAGMTLFNNLQGGVLNSRDFVTVYDSRTLNNPTKTRYEGPAAWMILFCNESLKTLEQIQERVESQGKEKYGDRLIEEVVQDLESKRILYGENGKYLTLALPHNSQL